MKSGNVALVTGGSRGIGAAIVAELKAQGWKVATCARKLESLAESPADFKFACDVTNGAQVQAGVAEMLKHLGRIDALVNNAGLAGNTPLDGDDALWHSIIDTNLNGTYYFCKTVLPHLPDGRGRIVNLGSVLSLKGVPDSPAYCAAKHAVLGFTRSLAHLAAPRKITANCVCPGWTRTEMAEGRIAEMGWNLAGLEKSVPIGRILEPKEVASFVAYLLSEQAGGITGQALTIDGGVLA